MSYASPQPPLGFGFRPGSAAPDGSWARHHFSPGTFRGQRHGWPSLPQMIGLAAAVKAMHARAAHSAGCGTASSDQDEDPRAYTHSGQSRGRGGWGSFPMFRPPFGGPGQGGPGGGGPFPFGPPWGGGQKARRGDIRTAILAVLADGPRNGYQVIGEIAERSGGVWRPSPGSIYPTLSQLEDEGLVRADESGGRRLYDLTEAGRAYVAEHPAEMASPWETMKDAAPDEWHETFGAFKHVAAATWQVMQTGTETQRAEARQILANTRRELYRVLGEGSSPDDEDDGVSS